MDSPFQLKHCGTDSNCAEGLSWNLTSWKCQQCYLNVRMFNHTQFWCIRRSAEQLEWHRRQSEISLQLCGHRVTGWMPNVGAKTKYLQAGGTGVDACVWGSLCRLRMQMISVYFLSSEDDQSDEDQSIFSPGYNCTLNISNIITQLNIGLKKKLQWLILVEKNLA